MTGRYLKHHWLWLYETSKEKNYISNFVWVEKLSLQEEKVAILHLSVSTTLSESIPDGHNCRYIDQQHLNIEDNDLAYPKFSGHPEHIANLSNLDDSLIEDKLEDTDHFNR